MTADTTSFQVQDRHDPAMAAGRQWASLGARHIQGVKRLYM